LMLSLSLLLNWLVILRSSVCSFWTSFSKLRT
jgi:hypothetical protein